MTLGERIKRWREWAGFSKAELAARCGVSDAAAGYWELDEEHEKSSHPTHRNVERIADAVGITVPMFWSEPPRGKRAAS